MGEKSTVVVSDKYVGLDLEYYQPTFILDRNYEFDLLSIQRLNFIYSVYILLVNMTLIKIDLLANIEI